MRFFQVTVFALGLFFAALRPPVLAQDAGNKKDAPKLPPSLKTYEGRRIAQTMHFLGAPWLVRESREREEECSTLIKVLKIKPGQTICDMGSGNGFYTLKMAAMLEGKGQILAVDIQPEMLKLLKERAKKAKIECVDPLLRPVKGEAPPKGLVVPVLGSLLDPYLPAGKLDLVFCVDVYHEFSHPVYMLQEIRNSLAAGGRLCLVEFRLEDPKVPIKLLHKMSKKQVNKEMAANGFKLVEEYDKLPWQHVMFFARDDAWKGPAIDPRTGKPLGVN